MKKKIIIILAIVAVCILIASPVFAKEKVKIKITDGDFVLNNKGYIVIKLVDKNGREIKSNGMVNFTITDKNGNYKWVYKAYKSGIRVKYPVGKYNVKVKFFGDSKYKKAVKTRNVVIKDNFDHEAFFVIFPDNKRRERGCVVITGCSHCGIINVLKTVNAAFPDYPIISVIGGFHMMGSSTKKLCCTEEYVDKTVNEIKAIDTGVLYTCHCTGLAGYSMMKPRLGERIQYLQTGEELEF